MLDMMNRIQNQLRDVELREEPCDPGQIIGQVTQNLTPYILKQQVEVVSELDETLRLYGDGVQLREVITNLCMNALEAMKSGGKLHLQLFLSHKHLIITVADTGTGITKENLPHVLDPFFSTKRTGQNFGLGLSYCYNVMQKHQGQLEIYSEQGKGTTVFLFFPKKRVIINDSE
ncbi:hypothetical protein BBR01nite_43950 [Brevibacillus brevis]|nr:HAMP domain-containing sensor histidine kinase [Brevibacillus brevis]GEC92064.1 hypothetical protein BBR01nite_43950 [Brevibacillus brevis]